MEYKIVKIHEKDPSAKNQETLTALSGYCLINLIAKRLSEHEDIIPDNITINSDFWAYDYNKMGERLKNEQYVTYAEDYVRHVK